MSLITNTDSTIFPYNDDEMVYDLDLRMYILTDVACNDYIGDDLIGEEYFNGNTTKYDRFREEISEDIYEYIFSYTHVTSVKTKRYIMAKNPDLRESIKQALKYQLRYNVRSSANILKDMHGVNIEKGKALALSSIRGRVGFSPQAHNVLARNGLLYTGSGYNILDVEEDGTY